VVLNYSAGMVSPGYPDIRGQLEKGFSSQAKIQKRMRVRSQRKNGFTRKIILCMSLAAKEEAANIGS
jgi:hypothetical protein